jgi:hypothetical protein
MSATYEVHTDERTLNIEVGGTFARLPGERVLAVRRFPSAKVEAIGPEERRWFIKTLTPHSDWTSEV